MEKAFRELGILQERIEVVKSTIKNPEDYDLDLVYDEIVKIGYLLDYLSGHEFGVIWERLESACRGNRANLLTTCVSYVTSFFNLTRDFLTLKLGM